MDRREVKDLISASSLTPALRWVREELQQLSARGLERRRKLRTSQQGPIIRLEGRDVLNFGSNDYLGLASDPRLMQAAISSFRQEGWGSGASALVSGFSDSHGRLAEALAHFWNAEAALVFPSGYMANLGTIAALVGPGDVIYCDQRNHASIWDGARLSRADIRTYTHNDLSNLQRLLQKRGNYRRALIVTDSLFSIDGDLAPLPELAELAARYECMFVVDEAHALGIFGPRGGGVGESFRLQSRIDVRVGTLSKALGCAGGFIAGARELVEWLVNRARSYIFTTAMPAPLAAAAIQALEIVQNEPFRGAQLLLRAAELRHHLQAQGWTIGASQSQIIPIMVGAPEAAVKLSELLFEKGIYVPAMRPPTVPEGQACLRISLTWAHQPEMLEQLLVSLRGLRARFV